MSEPPFGESEARALLRRVLDKAGGEAEAALGGGALSLTRFANNRIHQNVHEQWPRLSLRVVRRDGAGARSARAWTSRVDDDGIDELVADARALVRVAAPQPHLLEPPAPPPAPGEPVDAWDPRAAAAGPAMRADAAGRCILPARRKGLVAAGLFATHRMSLGDYGDAGMFAVMSSGGLFAWHRRTRVACSCTVMGDDSSGWAQADSHTFEAIDPEALALVAVDKAARSRRPEPLEPGRATVVLEPEAVASLLWFLLPSFSAQAVQEERSLLTGRIGERLFGERLHLADDCFHPLHRGRPFDGEGVPTRKLALVTGGVASGLTYSRDEAERAGGSAAPTGHGPERPSTEGSHPRFPVLTVEGPAASMDDLVREAGDGVLVTRLWYNRFLDARKVIVTGMTRDGTFRLRKGRLAGGVRNLRYNVSVPELLQRVVAASAPVRAGGMVVPGLLVRDFPFTSATRF